MLLLVTCKVADIGSSMASDHTDQDRINSSSQIGPLSVHEIGLSSSINSIRTVAQIAITVNPSPVSHPRPNANWRPSRMSPCSPLRLSSGSCADDFPLYKEICMKVRPASSIGSTRLKTHIRLLIPIHIEIIHLPFGL